MDLDGSKASAEGRPGPHIFIRGNKADTPHWMPLHPAAVEALRALRREPVIGPAGFRVRSSHHPDSHVSRLFADLCVKGGLTEEVERDGAIVVMNRWSLCLGSRFKWNPSAGFFERLLAIRTIALIANARRSHPLGNEASGGSRGAAMSPPGRGQGCPRNLGTEASRAEAC